MSAGFDSLSHNKIGMGGLDGQGLRKAGRADANRNSERMRFFNNTFGRQAKMKAEDCWSSIPNRL